MQTGEAVASAYGTVGAPNFTPANFRSLDDVQQAVEVTGGDLEAVVTELGGSTVDLGSLDDWPGFRERSGLNLSDAAMRCLCQAAVS